MVTLVKYISFYLIILICLSSIGWAAKDVKNVKNAKRVKTDLELNELVGKCNQNTCQNKACFTLGYELAVRGKYFRAVDYIQKCNQHPEIKRQLKWSCKKGDDIACLDYALVLDLVVGQKERANEIYQKYCKQGNSAACIWGQNPSLNDLCQKDHVKSCIAVGIKAYKEEKDFAKAKQLLSKVCESGSDVACYELGILMLSEQQRELAVDYLKKHCEKGLGRTCTLYGLLLAREDELDEAQALYLKSCDLKASSGCRLYGEMLLMNENPVKGIEYIKRACDQTGIRGEAQACHLMGEIKVKMGAKKESVDFYESACIDGIKDSCIIAADHRKADPIFYNLAVHNYRQACDLGDKESCMHAADMYQKDLENPVMAHFYYNKSCKHNNQEACLKSKEIAVLVEMIGKVQEKKMEKKYLHQEKLKAQKKRKLLAKQKKQREKKRLKLAKQRQENQRRQHRKAILSMVKQDLDNVTNNVKKEFNYILKCLDRKLGRVPLIGFGNIQCDKEKYNEPRACMDAINKLSQHLKSSESMFKSTTKTLVDTYVELLDKKEDENLTISELDELKRQKVSRFLSSAANKIEKNYFPVLCINKRLKILRAAKKEEYGR